MPANRQFYAGNKFATANVFGPLMLHTNTNSQLKRLAAGAVIAGGAYFDASQNELAFFQNGVHATGTRGKNQIGYAGFELQNGDLGWLRLEWTSTDGNPGPNELTLLGWAYDNVPGRNHPGRPNRSRPRTRHHRPGRRGRGLPAPLEKSQGDRQAA